MLSGLCTVSSDLKPGSLGLPIGGRAAFGVPVESVLVGIAKEPFHMRTHLCFTVFVSEHFTYEFQGCAEFVFLARYSFA